MSGSLGPRIRAAVAEEVVAELRHDLRNHLAAVRNAAYYIRRRAEKTPLWTDDPRVAAFLELIASESTRADERLGERGAPCAGTEGAAHVGAAIGRALDGLPVPAGVVVRHETPPGLSIAGSEEDLALAARMILENAIEAVGGGGEVRVSAGYAHGAVQVEIRDTGPGIGDPDRAREARWTTKPGRLGLGLPIAARAMRRLGGEVVFAPADRGARVLLRGPSGGSLP